MTIISAIALVAAISLIAYLVYALVKPERFL